MKFYFTETDTELSGKEMFLAVLLSVIVASFPFVVKALLSLI